MDEFQQQQPQQRNFNFDMYQQGGQTPNESNELGNNSAMPMPFPSQQIPGNENNTGSNIGGATPTGMGQHQQQQQQQQQNMNSPNKQKQFDNSQNGSSSNDFTMLENFNGPKPQTPGDPNFTTFNNTTTAPHNFNNTNKAAVPNF